MASHHESAPEGLPTLTRSQIEAWDVDHLREAASSWTATAGRWRDGFSTIDSGILRPSGTEWTGRAADAAAARTDRDRVQVVGLSERLNAAAAVATAGAADIAAAKASALLAIVTATRSGFAVSEDLVVRDQLPVQAKPAAVLRNLQARIYAADIQAQALQLTATDQGVAAKLNTFVAGFGNLEFPQSPPSEPSPPKIPMPPYEPTIWGACAVGGRGDPNKVVRTFYRAPLTDGVSAMPGGDSVLYCGNDKYGFYHLVNEHGPQWQNMASSGFPSGGNWRYLADYSISATLANPERVVYDSQRDTFAVYRNIYRITEDGPVYAFTCRVVVSGTDGKIITAFPSSKPI